MKKYNFDEYMSLEFIHDTLLDSEITKNIKVGDGNEPYPCHDGEMQFNVDDDEYKMIIGHKKSHNDAIDEDITTVKLNREPNKKLKDYLDWLE